MLSKKRLALSLCAVSAVLYVVGAASAQADAPATQSSRSPSPSEQLKSRETKMPVLRAADDVGRFLDWAGASHVDEAEAARATIVRAGRSSALVSRLIEEVEKTQFADFSRALLALGVLGEMKSPVAEKYLTEFVRRPLPEKGTEVDGEILEQTWAAMLQGKAADALAYLKTERADRVIFELVAKHASRIVRAEAINAYLWNHGDSAEAKRTLEQYVSGDELVFLDRVRRVSAEDGKVFNARLAAFLTAHPEVIPPDPRPGNGDPQTPNDGAKFDQSPPAF
jgi:hypothetical protein